ncbi:MAG: glycosyltransferase [Xanthomonadales bacterium]|nr:glycosyltransferase [Xanthomonadales bacterium]
MKLVVFGLAVSSSWGNGHATLWRGLITALNQLGHRVVFFERDQPWYAGARDLTALPGGELVIYPSWGAVRERARRELADADAAMLTSYCPDAAEARRTMLDSRAMPVFYDLDTPVTLEHIAAGERPEWIGPGLESFDLILSYAGGPALEALHHLGARRTAPLYGHVDPDSYRPAAAEPRFSAALSWLGTFAEDRQAALEALFIEPARRRPDLSFLIGGAQYPADFPWTTNIRFARHVAPPEHPAFLCSARLNLNITRAPMARMGWCPSGRLFEASACAAPLLSDHWPGLEDFYQPGGEILVARSTADALAALELADAELRRIGRAARERTLAEHTSLHRARELVARLEEARHPRAEALIEEEV